VVESCSSSVGAEKQIEAFRCGAALGGFVRRRCGAALGGSFGGWAAARRCGGRKSDRSVEYIVEGEHPRR
jgi:hypothetical protein